MAGKTYEKAGKAITDRVARVLRTIHASRLCPPVDPLKPNDEKYAIQIESIIAYGRRDKYGIVTGAAITAGGREALACIRITKLEERVAGRGDAIIWFDGDKLKEWSPETLDAIIDHELTHFEPVDGKLGPEFDDIGRLCLRMRPHDFQVGWFEEVAERHGLHAIEAQQAALLATQQLYFPGFEIKPKGGKKRSA
jgi:hypothetical protein